MKTFWLNKKNNQKLILFFCGWGMDETPLKHLNCGDFDVLVIYDYSNLDFKKNLENYAEINLIAWSMGVLVSGIVAKGLNIKKSIAINGTQKPIDSQFGIHPKIYQLTLDNMSETTRNRFFANMFKNKNDYKNFKQPLRALENQHNELSWLKELALNKESQFDFDCAIISSHDKIIPPENQKNFWKTKKVKVVELDSGHYPFFEFQSMEEILNETL